MKTISPSTPPTSGKKISRSWHLINVEGKIVGRQASVITSLLLGKGKVTQISNLDQGDYVVVLNVAKLNIPAGRMDKEFDNYSGYPGGRKVTTMKRLLNEKPDQIIRRAVAGMLPRNKYRKDRLARLYIYPGEEHPYGARFSR